MAINQLQAPINYMGMMPQVDIGRGIAEFGQVIQERKQAEQLQLQQQQYAKDLQNAINNPTQKTWSEMIAKYPKNREAFESARKGYGEDRADSEFKQGFEISMAMENGKPEIAKAQIQSIIEQKKNAGEQPGVYQQIFDALESGNVSGAQAAVNASLSMIDPKKFTDFVKARATPQVETAKAEQAIAEATIAKATAENAGEKAKAEAALAVANAQKAAVAAKFAESSAAMDLQKKGWDITKIQEDIKIARQNASIAAMNASIAREGNAIKREENQLKLQDMIQKRDEAVRTKAADLESARTNMDNMLNTADRILKTPIGVIGSAAGPVSSRMPTIRQDTSDFEALVETLGSQSFLAQIPNIKGMGALSNAEGEKLQAALQNFSLKQSPERLLENVKEAQRLIMKARKNMTARTGLPESIPDTPAVSTSGSDIDAIVKKYTQGPR